MTSLGCSLALLLTLLAALLCAVVPVDGKGEKKPASHYFDLCPRKDAKALGACLKKNLIERKSLMSTGIPSLGLIALDPLFIPKLVFKEGGSFNLDTTMTNLTMKGVGGFSDMNVNAEMNDKGMTLELSITIPALWINGNYEIDGRILLLPIKGNGFFEINSTNTVVVAHMASKVVSRGGKQYLAVDSVKCSIDLKGTSRSWFYNLFNGDKLLGDATNNFLNENYQESHEATKHMPEGALQELTKENIANVFNRYSIDELFLK